MGWDHSAKESCVHKSFVQCIGASAGSLSAAPESGCLSASWRRVSRHAAPGRGWKVFLRGGTRCSSVQAARIGDWKRQAPSGAPRMPSLCLALACNRGSGRASSQRSGTFAPLRGNAPPVAVEEPAQKPCSESAGSTLSRGVTIYHFTNCQSTTAQPCPSRV